MKILHITSASTWRGGERQIYLLLEGLKENGFENYLMAPDGSVIKQRSAEFIISDTKFNRGFLSTLKNVKSLRAFCRKHQIDIIHGHDSHAHTVLWMAYVYRGLNTKSVVTRRLVNSVKSRSIKKYNYSRIERIICISKAVQDALSPSIKNKSRLQLIHSGIRLKEIGNTKSSGNENYSFTVGYVAAFTEEKDHYTFLKVADYIEKNYPNLSMEYVLAGDGPLKNQIEKDCEGKVSKFNFTGFVEDVGEWYSKMDVLLHTSKSEALGTSILDAMMYGLPVIASKTGGIPEIIEHEKHGYLYKSGDYENMAEALVHLMKNPEAHKKIGEENLIRAKDFSSDKMTMETIKVYNSLMGN